MRTTTPPPLPLRIITHNIRYATTSPFKGEMPWPDRAPLLLSSLQYHTRSLPSTLLCLQEVLSSQLTDILSSLRTKSSLSWTSIGVGRKDGLTLGEYAPIIYREDVWEMLHFETIWLSQTPNVPGSKGWDAASVRIVTVGVLLHKESGRKVLCMNTHLDDQGIESRIEGARMIVKLHRGLRAAWGVQLSFLAGDLNSEASESEVDAWGILNEQGSGFCDARRMLREDDCVRDYGNETTFTGFRRKTDGEGMTRIDFIHIGVDEEGRAELKLVVEGYAVLPNKFDDGVYMSDHRAVVTDILIG